MVTLCNSCEFQDTCEIFEIMGDSMPITHCKNYIQTRRETVRCKQTNGDRIRAMTDEELAEWLASIVECDDGCPCIKECCEKEEMGFCYQSMLEWLRKEAEDGHTE